MLARGPTFQLPRCQAMGAPNMLHTKLMYVICGNVSLMLSCGRGICLMGNRTYPSPIGMHAGKGVASRILDLEVATNIVLNQRQFCCACADAPALVLSKEARGAGTARKCERS